MVAKIFNFLYFNWRGFGFGRFILTIISVDQARGAVRSGYQIWICLADAAEPMSNSAKN